MTTDTDALLANLRSDLGNLDPAVHGEDLQAATKHALDDLDSLAAELERETQEHRACGESLLEATAKWEAAEAELERVKAERDEHQRVRGLLFRDLEKALSALRVIASLDPDWTQRDAESVYGIARAALAEIEGEA